MINYDNQQHGSVRVKGICLSRVPIAEFDERCGSWTPPTDRPYLRKFTGRLRQTSSYLSSRSICYQPLYHMHHLSRCSCSMAPQFQFLLEVGRSSCKAQPHHLIMQRRPTRPTTHISCTYCSPSPRIISLMHVKEKS